MRIYTLILRLRISAGTKTIEMTLWTDIRTDGHTDALLALSQEAQKVYAVLYGFIHQ